MRFWFVPSFVCITLLLYIRFLSFLRTQKSSPTPNGPFFLWKPWFIMFWSILFELSMVCSNKILKNHNFSHTGQLVRTKVVLFERDHSGRISSTWTSTETFLITNLFFSPYNPNKLNAWLKIPTFKIKYSSFVQNFKFNPFPLNFQDKFKH